ncbi:PREDICTED: protein artichoke-like [Atta colombica]|uniref:protein artichoke-like n=1 Tax=Atta colombica TaxID=520822 RepID=UPI00084C1F6C|nr:PREDICTED: protein artichoke-like [Atta colombica]
MDESLQSLCNDDISLNFSNAVISEIKRDFISMFVQENPFMESHFTYTTPMISQNWMSFPKLKILDLSENNMRRTNFVQLLSNSLYFLDLHGNSLSNLNLNEKGKKLFALNLDENNFNNIQQYNGYSKTLSMAGLKNLHYLSVSRNEINTIESDAFRDNNELLFLNLSSNDIHYLHPKTFANLQYLETLDLSINQLENVPQISNETEISTLCINNNNIKKIISHTFVYMPKLIKLLMGMNQIDKIDVNAFVHLIVLEELDLSRNMLSSLPEGWTKSLISLKYLDLSDNKFTSLESLPLTNTLPLITIYLMKNSLEYLNVKYFENLPQNLTINLI